MVFFSLIVTFLILAFSFYLMYTFQRRTTVQSAEFNLQLVASVIEQDLRDLTALGIWCGQSSQIAAYFLTDFRAPAYNLEAYNRLLEEYLNNRAGRYVRRLIIFDFPAQKLLQVGNSASTSIPVTVYNLGKIAEAGVAADSTWQPLIRDPFAFGNSDSGNPDSMVIPFVTPLYNTSEGKTAGTVFLAATVNLVTDKLRGYNLPENSELYFNLGDLFYRIEDAHMVQTDFSYEIVGRNTADPLSRNTTALTVRDTGGRRHALVSYPVRDGIALTQVLSDIRFFPRESWWAGLVAGLCMLILFLALVITLNLDRSISRPVARLRKKIDAISRGDFSPDPDLESDNELGQVGYGVNLMAREITALLDKRIGDEKSKRDLEYRMLQGQINPHFLYNTLNSIKWMASIQNASGIAEMTTALSRLLRKVSKDTRKMVPLGEELELLDDYLIIQKYRYGGSVNFKRIISREDLLRVSIPRFVLQPLVENAIFHGIEPRGSGLITLEITANEDVPHASPPEKGPSFGEVTVSITDDGVGMSRETIGNIKTASWDKSGMFRKMGIANVDERLRYAFGEEYGLSVSSEEGKYTTMKLRLPGKISGENSREASGEKAVEVLQGSSRG
jgi:two-component system sensor histidine kinase YesM